MFGLSLSKILLLVLVVAAVWYGFKWVKRMQVKRDAAGGPARPAAPGTDLSACPACGTYVAAGVAQCPSKRSDCPMLAG